MASTPFAFAVSTPSGVAFVIALFSLAGSCPPIARESSLSTCRKCAPRFFLITSSLNCTFISSAGIFHVSLKSLVVFHPFTHSTSRPPLESSTAIAFSAFLLMPLSFSSKASINTCVFCWLSAAASWFSSTRLAKLGPCTDSSFLNLWTLYTARVASVSVETPLMTTKPSGAPALSGFPSASRSLWSTRMTNGPRSMYTSILPSPCVRAASVRSTCSAIATSTSCGTAPDPLCAALTARCPSPCCGCTPSSSK
mmetsp:Transcript_8959/g.20968  ORF Transcript_8959/g.20968 Transcript_8959/m.20968 type:complete len:253 (-) Transcript_8959:340-1098(-)